MLLIHKQDSRVRKFRFGHDGYAQLADGLESNSWDVVGGDSDVPDDVNDGGETCDFNGMLMGLAKADSKLSDEVDEDGESDALLSLSESIAVCVA